MTEVVHDQDFPFDEVRDDVIGGLGDYFKSIKDAQSAGFDLSQIWSVIETDGVYSYGPSHHFVNLLGYVCTKEKHDGATYYIYDVNEDMNPQ